MSNTKHTPGPWIPYYAVYLPKNVFKVGKDRGKGFQCIADCSYETTHGADGEEALANAKLIAAAPDLAEALKAVIEYFGHSALSNYEYPDHIQKARAALAKAGVE